MFESLPGNMKHAFATLLEAYDFALDTRSDPWDFAVDIDNLKSLGLNENNLRWLVKKGYIRHAREVTLLGDDGREFRATGNLSFASRTCIVLTMDGVAWARSDAALLPTTNPSLSVAHLSGQKATDAVANWDSETRTLSLNGQVVKRFKWPAANQESILNAFQEEGWPNRVDDPLSPRDEQDPKRRLADTIKCLNRKQTNQLIRFRGDGTGEGVVWERLSVISTFQRVAQNNGI